MFYFKDAQKMQKDFPDTFEAPSIKALQKLKPKDFIKISHNNERFWVEINTIEENIIKGRIDNDLILKQPFKCDDIIECEKRHVYSILKGE